MASFATNAFFRSAFFSILCLTAACAQKTTLPEAEPTVAKAESQPVETSFEIPPARKISFADWKAGFRGKALAAGIDAGLFERIFSGMTPDSTILTADSRQPEFVRPVWEYLAGAVSAARIDQGRNKMQQQGAVLQRIASRYTVNSEVLVAIWGMESSYGQQMGNKNILRSLATLAYKGRRQAFAEEQLLAALRIVQHGDIAYDRMLGSWAGAMGHTQFMPTTYNRYAIDFDGDGKRDIWNSAADALASAAHYLQASGWRSGVIWGSEVNLPKGFDYALAELDILEPVSYWQRLGITRVDGASLANLGNTASLLLPAGHQGPAFLVTDNFRAIMKYNNSTSYALAIGLLSDALRQGKVTIMAPWPTHERPLNSNERQALQERLAQRGFNPGAIDGIIGINSRKAIRAYQQSQNLPADGYPTADLLHRLNH